MKPALSSTSDHPLDHFPTAAEKRFFAQVATRQRGRPLQEGSSEECIAVARQLAERIRLYETAIRQALASCTTRPSVDDEIDRSLDLLDNLAENQEYFCGKVPLIASIMPRNQLLYALLYMAVVPALQAQKLVVRPPAVGLAIVSELVAILQLSQLVPWLELSSLDHTRFADTFVSVADITLFAGTEETAQKVRQSVPKGSLFLLNGAGHNPIVVGPSADVQLAVASILKVAYHNQGQDCAAPNAILVHATVLSDLKRALQARTTALMVDYRPGYPLNHTIGPNTDRTHVAAIAKWLLSHQANIVYGGQIDVSDSVIFPTIVEKPLSAGPSYQELFAPIILLQPFNSEEELDAYFGTTEYRARAMYVTIFGDTDYMRSGLDQRVHPADTVIRNTDLHAHERGTRPYGGYGPQASAILMDKARLPTPLLSQREIFRFLILPRKHSSAASTSDLTKPQATGPFTRIDKLEKLRALGVDPYPADFAVTATVHDLVERYSSLALDERVRGIAAIAGRVSAMRNSGMFFDVKDTTGKVQVFFDRHEHSSLSQEVVDQIDIGDVVGVRGTIRRTKRGELTIDANSIHVLAKALTPIPDKKSLDDPEARYRLRHIDFIINDGARALVRARSNIVAGLRSHLISHSFLEMETPMLHRVSADAVPELLTIHSTAMRENLYLRSAPEAYLRRLLIGGIGDRLFEINRSFRDDVLSPEHTTLEVHQSYTGTASMRALLEGLLCGAQRSVSNGDSTEMFKGFTTPIPELHYHDSVQEQLGIDFRSIQCDAAARDCALHLGMPVRGDESWGEILETLFQQYVQPRLVGPTHVVDVPAHMCPFSRASASGDIRFADASELYIGGLKIGKVFAHLNDPAEQHRRLAEQVAKAHGKGALDRELDEDFLSAMTHGMPPGSAVTIYVDTLVMLLTNTTTAREVLTFPQAQRRAA